MEKTVSFKYDNFIERALRRVQPEFAFITPRYGFDLPAALTWVLVKALVSEQGLNARSAAQVVLDFCERRGDEIPMLLNSPQPAEPASQIEAWQ